MPGNKPLKAAALEYAAAGFRIFPMVPNGKKPLIKDNFKQATTDPKQIEKWWNWKPNANIGFPVGNGIVAIDLDVNHGDSTADGIGVYKEFVKEHGEFPATAACRTPRGGLHLYYRINDAVTTSSNTVLGIDIGAKGHSMLLPPSVTEYGQYKWEGPSIIDGIADANDAVMEFIKEWSGKKKKASSPVYQSNSSSNTFYAPGEIIQEGGRHAFLLSQLGKMMRAGLSDEIIRQRIYELNQTQCDPPQSEEELECNILEALDRYREEEPEMNDKLDTSIASIRDLTSRIIQLNVFENPKYRNMNDISLSKAFADCLKDVCRYNTIPFERQFTPEERDIGLKNRLLKLHNLSGILNWLIEGCKKSQQPGAFEPPEKVQKATEEYRRSSDKVQNFVEDCLIESERSVLAAKDVYQEYSRWCSTSGYGVENKVTFFDDLRKKNLMSASGTINGTSVHNVVKGYAFKAPPMPF